MKHMPPDMPNQPRHHCYKKPVKETQFVTVDELKKIPWAIKNIEDPTYEQYKAALAKDPWLIKDLKDAPEGIKKIAISKIGNFLLDKWIVTFCEIE